MTAEAPTIPDAPQSTVAPADGAGIAVKSYSCPNCARDFSKPSKGPGQHKRFCSSECRMAWAAREKVQGAAVVTLAKIWRKARGTGPAAKAAFAELISTLDLMMAEDAAAGRPPLTEAGPVGHYVRAVVSERYVDKRRR